MKIVSHYYSSISIYFWNQIINISDSLSDTDSDGSIQTDLNLPAGQCLKIVGGTLLSADCNDQMLFACEKLALGWCFVKSCDQFQVTWFLRSQQ